MKTELQLVNLAQLRQLLPAPMPLVTGRKRQDREQWLTRTTPLMSPPDKELESTWVPVTHGEVVPVQLFPLVFRADVAWAWVDGIIAGQTLPDGELLLLVIGTGEDTEWVKVEEELRPRIWIGAAILVKQ